ncbi:MAG: pitrilysin family protein [Armatimonadaceae bacterium]
MSETVEKTTLSNGIRIVTESIPHVQSIALGIWVASGSRYEAENRRGISHFLEHMLFKGTARRPTAKQIADEMEDVGGSLNAFTDKEYTCYYARALAEHLPLTVDILTDMFHNSLFDPEETARERKVVLEEIKRRDDDPDDLVHDFFAQTIYPEHPLGLPVIGTAEVVASLTPDDLREYIRAFYGPEKVIVTAAGNLEHARVVDAVAAALGEMAPHTGELPTVSPSVVRVTSHYSRPTEQVNFCIGTNGYGQLDDERYALAIMDTVVGGSMGSRLFQEIREKRGLAYSVGSYSAMHREGGYYVAYGGTSPDTYEECIEVIKEEFGKVRREGISDVELQRAKNQFRASIVMGQESMSRRMDRLGRSEVYYGRVIPFDEVLAAIDAVTLDDVQAIAEAVFPENPDDLTVAAVGPFDLPAAPDYEEMDAEREEIEAEEGE